MNSGGYIKAGVIKELIESLEVNLIFGE